MEPELLEHEIEGTVWATAEEYGWVVRKLKWVGRRGGPDTFFVKSGRLVLIEFKRSGLKPRGQQGKEFQRIRAEWSGTYVVDSVEEGLAILGIPVSE